MTRVKKDQSRFGIFILALIAGSIACNLPGASPTELPAGESETAIAGTVAARIALTSTVEASATQVSPVATNPPLASATVPGVSATPTLARTATPAVPLVSVSVNTNCRSGPARVYDYLGALLVGETEEVVAQSTVPNYWYITNPDRPGGFCYLWGEHATVVGDTQNLPEFTPLPSPTATNTPTPSYTPTPSSTPNLTP